MPAAERRAQLLDVALQVFGEKGFHDTSMNDIGDAAGVTKPVLYQHFGSKRALFLEVLREVGGRLRDAVGKATASAEGPQQQVEQGFRAYFTWVAQTRGGFDVLFAGETRRDPRVRLGSVEGRDRDRRRDRPDDRGRRAGRGASTPARVRHRRAGRDHVETLAVERPRRRRRSARAAVCRPGVGRPARVARLTRSSVRPSPVPKMAP